MGVLTLPDFTLQTFLLFLGVLLLSWFILREWSIKKNLPPGPKGLLSAIVYNIRNGRGSNPVVGLGKMRERYKSDICASTAGWQVAIILNTFDLVKQAFLKREDLVDRPKSFAFEVFGNQKGIVGNNGQAWKEQRRFALSVLRDFGMGKSMLEDKITEETTYLAKELEKHHNEDLDLHFLLNTSVANIICSIVFGQRYQHDDEEFSNYLKTINFTISKLRMAVIATDVFPFLQYLPGDLFNIDKINKNRVKVMGHIQRKIDQHKDTLNPDNIRSFIDAYLIEMEKRRKVDSDTSFTDDQLSVVVADLFVAGSETTTSTLRWAILYMILYPDVQEKVQAEIDDVIGQERRPTSGDRSKMPYTDAVLMEINRAGSIVPFGAPHGNISQDVQFEGYNIPKQAIVAGNIYAIHHDATYWQYPDTFNPNNFLDDDGNVVHRERLIPFLIGRRACPGEALAKMELFIFFTSLLQRFRFSIPEGAPRPSTDGEVSITLQPKSYKVHLALRSRLHQDSTAE